MRRIKIVILGIMLISYSAIGQDLSFDIHNTSLSEYIKNEEKLGSKRISTKSNHVSFSGEAQPIKFQRNEDTIPDLIVYYFFKEIDSTMTFIRYEWDVTNFEKKDNNQKTKKFGDALIKKYRKIKNEIIQDFGKPITKSNYSNISELDPENIFEENSTWKPNDSTEIELYITVSNYYEKKETSNNGIIQSSTINPTHRIRLYVRNKPKKSEIDIPELDDDKLKELDRLSTEFLRTLELKDLSKSREYLSELIKDKVSDEQISILIENIDFDRETKLIYSGIQIRSNGERFTLLQYKYSDDKSNPPSQLIKIVFDNKDKIVGIQPSSKIN